MPSVSSPSSPADSGASGQSHQGADGPNLGAPPKLKRRGSFQLEPLNVEQLPSHRPRGPPLGAQLRKRQFASKQPIGGRSHAHHPNLPPSPQRQAFATQTSEPKGSTESGDQNAATVSFLTQTGAAQLPNIPLHESGQTSGSQEETTSFHEDEYDSHSTTGIIRSGKSPTGTFSPKRKTFSPSGETKEPSGSKRKVRTSMDQGKRPKKKS